MRTIGGIGRRRRSRAVTVHLAATVLLVALADGPDRGCAGVTGATVAGQPHDLARDVALLVAQGLRTTS
jgi:hypothetical protein